jgi:replicative DNA helicase
LAEHLVKINRSDNPDFFVIDSLDYIGKEKPFFLNQNKKYQKQLRHLKVLAQAMNKLIYLLTSIDQSIEECEPFFYHRKVHREKYADYILILYRWEYYQEPFITEGGTPLKENEALLIVGKSPKEQNTNYSILKYDPANRSFKVK